MFSGYQKQKTHHDTRNFSRNLSSLIIFTSASLLFLFCSSLKVYANDTFDCFAMDVPGDVITSMSYNGSSGQITASCMDLPGLNSGGATCGGEWLAVPGSENNDQPECRDCTPNPSYLTDKWIEIRCPSDKVATKVHAKNETGCKSHGFTLYCAPLPSDWEFGGSTRQALVGIKAINGGSNPEDDSFEYFYSNIQPRPPSCTLTFSPTSGLATQAVNYTWTQTNSDNTAVANCSNGGPQNVSLNGNGSGAFTPGATMTCTMTVDNASSQTNTCSATFTLDSPPASPSCTLTFSPTSGTSTTSVTYNWTQTNDANNESPYTCTNGGPTGTLSGNNPVPGAGSFFTPGKTMTCTMTVTNAASPPQSNTCSATFTLAACTGPFSFTWEDSPLQDGSQPNPTRIRARHFIQMRDNIETLRVDAGLSPFDWTGCGFNAANNLPISTKLINCPRQALREVYTACSQAIPDGIQGSVGEDTPIRKQHVENLRDAINREE